MQRKRKNKSTRGVTNKAVTRLAAEMPVNTGARLCPWVVTVKAGVKAFRRFYGLARHYSRGFGFWSEVQPGELRFHFSNYDVAVAFVAYCLKRKLEVEFRDDSKPRELQDLDSLRNKPEPPRAEFFMVKKTPEMRIYPMRLELAGFYSSDAFDFLRRYQATFYSNEVDFQGIKSRRAKAYVDLRMALEAALKAAVCLRAPYAMGGKPLVTKIRTYSHDIERLRKDALRGIDVDSRYLVPISKCNIAPVDLRYQFDAMNFRFPDDRNYYETIGSNLWLKTIEKFVELCIERVQSALSRRSKIVSGDILIQELDRPSDYPSG